MRLYLDMDGVIADFDAALLARGIKPCGNYVASPKEHWTEEQAEHDRQARICMNDDWFWLNIPPMKDAYLLLTYARERDPGFKFLTARPSMENRADQVTLIKRMWLAYHFGVERSRVIVCLRSEKAKWSKEGSILVDDTHANCHEWEGAGGRAVLHRSAISTIEALEKIR